MFLLLGMLMLHTALQGGGAHSIKGRPTFGQKIIQEAQLVDDVPKTIGLAADPHSGALVPVVSGGEGTVQVQADDVFDPVSQEQHDALAGTGPGSVQFSLAGDPLYNIGLSKYPFGFSGNDYYSYPSYLTTPRRRTVISKGGVRDPSGLQLTLGDPERLKGFRGLGSRSSPHYRIGQSRYPFGLSGLDFSSFPNGFYSHGTPGIKTYVGGSPQQVASKTNRLLSGSSGLHYALRDPVSAKGFAGAADPLYSIGLSRYPFGLSGLDYYSYPSHLIPSARTPLLTKTSRNSNVGNLFGGRKGFSRSGGPGSVQFSVDDSQSKTLGGYGLSDPLYKIGQSTIPFGLSGMDYYSYPDNLYSIRRGKSVLSKTSSSGLGAPGNIHFALGDARDPLYKIGRSRVPFGLSGQDYYSFPARMYNRRRFLSKASRGIGNGFGIGALGDDNQGLVQAQEATLVDIDPAIADTPGNIQFTLGDSSLGGVKAVRRVAYRDGRSLVPFGLSGSDYYSYPTILLGKRGLSGKTSSGILSPFAGSLQSPALQEDIAAEALLDPAFGGASQDQIVQLSNSDDPASIQFTLGDHPLNSGFGTLYNIRRSQVPFGLSGMDFYSYPNSIFSRPLGKASRGPVRSLSQFGPQLQIQEKIADPSLGGQVIVDPVAPGNIQFTLGDSALASPLAVDSNFGQRKILTNSGLNLGEPKIVSQVSYVDSGAPVVVKSAPVRKVAKKVFRTPVLKPQPVEIDAGRQDIGSGIHFVLGDSSGRRDLLSRTTKPRLQPARSADSGSRIQFTLGGSQIISGPADDARRSSGHLRRIPERTIAVVPRRDTLHSSPVQPSGPGRIQFSLGEPAADIFGGRISQPIQTVHSKPVLKKIAPVQIPVGTGPNIAFTLGDKHPAVAVARPITQLNQFQVPDVGISDQVQVAPVTISQGSQFTVDDSQLLGDPSGITFGASDDPHGFGTQFLPRLSLASRFPYDSPFDWSTSTYGGPGLRKGGFGLRTSAIKTLQGSQDKLDQILLR